jgi:hypothetical protein
VRERAFLLSALFPRDLDLARLRALAAGPLDWEWMATAAHLAAAVPLLWNAVTAADLEDAIPEPVRARLRDEAEANAMQGALFLATLARVAVALERAGVESLALKGAALVLLAPDYLALRHMSDLDLLIRPAQQEQAAEVLRGLGGRVDSEERDLDGRLLTGEALRATESDSPSSFVLDGVLVELHQDVSGLPGDPLVDVEPLFARALRVTWRAAPIRVPDLADQVGILCHHVLRHHRDEPRLSPRHVADLEVLRARGADLAEARRRFDGSGAAPVRESLALSEATRRAAAHPARLRLSRCERGLSPAWQRLSARKLTFVTKLRLVRAHGLGFLFPSRRFLEARLGERTRGVPLPLLQARRLLRAAGRFLAGR